jgi:hypothetical protein
MAYPNKYPDEFQRLVKQLTKLKQEEEQKQKEDQNQEILHPFIGFGNPEAKLLIIGQEQALDFNGKDPEVIKILSQFNECKYHTAWLSYLNIIRLILSRNQRDAILHQIESVQNHDKWAENIKHSTKAPIGVFNYSIVNKIGYPNVLTNKNKELNPLQSAMVEWGKIFNPLWPYLWLSSTANINTWTAYQKLVYGTGCTNEQFVPYFFWMNAFVTEMNQEPSTTSKGINDSAVARSVNDRIDRILSHPFFKGFPIVVLACHDYVDIDKIERMFGEVKQIAPTVKFDSKSGINNSGNCYTVYQTKNKKQKIVLTRQLSNGSSDALIDAIRKALDI